MKTLTTLVAIASLCITGIAQTSIPLAKTISSITIDPSTADTCRPTVVENFTRHSVWKIGDHPSPRFALITQKFQVGSGCFESFDPARAVVSAKVVDINTGKVGKGNLWLFTTQGVSGEIESELYRVDMPGCCGSSPTSKYFSLSTGKLVSSSTGSLISVNSTQDHDLRYVSVEGNIASSRQSKAYGIATIYLGDTEALLETLEVSAGNKFDSEEWWVDSVGWKGKDATIKGLAVANFSEAVVHVVLRCRCEATPISIEVPMNQHGFVADKAEIAGLNGVTLSMKKHNPSLRRTAFGIR